MFVVDWRSLEWRTPTRWRLKTMASGEEQPSVPWSLRCSRSNSIVSGASKEQGSSGCEVPRDARLESWGRRNRLAQWPGRCPAGPRRSARTARCGAGQRPAPRRARRRESRQPRRGRTTFLTPRLSAPKHVGVSVSTRSGRPVTRLVANCERHSPILAFHGWHSRCKAAMHAVRLLTRLVQGGAQ